MLECFFSWGTSVKECPKLHLTTGLRNGPSANKQALLLETLTVACLFRKPTTLNEIMPAFFTDCFIMI
jgi:hypothetical protein